MRLEILDWPEVFTRREVRDFTAREKMVLVAILSGMSEKEMATELEISIATVKAHSAHVYRKLNLARYDGRRGILRWYSSIAHEAKVKR